jgi:hypothetical protein
VNRPRAATKAVDVYVHGLGLVFGIVVFGMVGIVVFNVVGGAVFGIVGGAVFGIDGVDFGIGGIDARVGNGVRAMRRSRFGSRSQVSGGAQPTRLRSRVEGGPGRRRLAWLTADGLVAHLLDQAARQLPRACRERFAEEWWDHCSHLRGLRLMWWALCVRATASRTGHELRRTELPRIEGS